MKDTLGQSSCPLQGGCSPWEVQNVWELWGSNILGPQAVSFVERLSMCPLSEIPL